MAKCCVFFAVQTIIKYYLDRLQIQRVNMLLHECLVSGNAHWWCTSWHWQACLPLHSHLHLDISGWSTSLLDSLGKTLTLYYAHCLFASVSVMRISLPNIQNLRNSKWILCKIISSSGSSSLWLTSVTLILMSIVFIKILEIQNVTMYDWLTNSMAQQPEAESWPPPLWEVSLSFVVSYCLCTISTQS